MLLAGGGGRGTEEGRRPRLGAGRVRCPRSSSELSPELCLQAKGASCSRRRWGKGLSSHHGSGVVELTVGVRRCGWRAGSREEGLQRVLEHLASVLKAKKGF